MKDMNSKNFGFIVLMLIVLGFSFGLAYVIGSFDTSSMYTQLVNGD